MTRPVRLREEAERDLVMAAPWYEEQRAGLGHRFLDKTLSALRSIAHRYCCSDAWKQASPSVAKSRLIVIDGEFIHIISVWRTSATEELIYDQ